MTRPWRRALWGYRPPAANLYLQALEAQFAERRVVREDALSQLRERLREAGEEIAVAESALNALQAEYFVLSGELNELSMRSQRTLEEARGEWTKREDQAHHAAQQRQEFSNHLARTIISVPERIHEIIGQMMAPLSPAAPAKQDAHAASSRPASESPWPDENSVGYPSV